jgi:hypothetical protein
MQWFLCHMIYSPETNATSVYFWYQARSHLLIFLLLLFLFRKMLTLLALVPLHHARLLLLSSSFSMLPPSSLSVDCLSLKPSGGPLSPKLTQFLSGPRQHLVSMSGTIIVPWMDYVCCVWKVLCSFTETILSLDLILFIIRVPAVVSPINGLE